MVGGVKLLYIAIHCDVTAVTVSTFHDNENEYVFLTAVGMCTYKKCK